MAMGKVSSDAGLSLASFRDLDGSNLDARFGPYYFWQLDRREAGTWSYDKTLESAPLPVGASYDGCGRHFRGANFSSQDYLSLASAPEIKVAAMEAIAEFGVHSAGLSALLGNTSISRKLAQELAQFLGYEHILLFPTGWAAGYGIVKGIVRPDDWIVMDALAHACLQEGARTATRNVVSFPHLDNEALRKRLRRIRASHPRQFILAITETLFSMDSDTPRFREYLDICREYQAVSLVDVAHDLGCLGEDGLGQLSAQGVLDEPDLLIGSFSKTFASNGGFIASKSVALKEYVKMYSSPQVFSNALSPVQVSVTRAALRFVQSPDGRVGRERLVANSIHLRDRLTDAGFECLGEPSAIVPVFLGADAPARTLWRVLSEQGVASNLIEFPGVATNRARIRLQVQSAHTKAQADDFVRELCLARASVASVAQEEDFVRRAYAE